MGWRRLINGRLLASGFFAGAFCFAPDLEPDFLEDDFFAGIVYPPFQSADAVGVNSCE